MESFYEKCREDDRQLVVHGNGNHSFPAHFHNNLEIFLVGRGEYEVVINGEKLVAKGGDVFVTDSYDVHEYKRIKERADEDARVLLIPYCLLGKFNARRKGFRFAEHRIADEKLCAELIGLTDGYLLGERAEGVREAGAALILSLLFERLAFTAEKPRDEVALMRKMLIYIQENFREKISRETLSRALGYTEAHISRVFHRYVKAGISEYVNGLRLDFIDKRLEEGYDGTRLELIFEAGFNSWQTYYRVRKKSKK